MRGTEKILYLSTDGAKSWQQKDTPVHFDHVIPHPNDATLFIGVHSNGKDGTNTIYVCQYVLTGTKPLTCDRGSGIEATRAGNDMDWSTRRTANQPVSSTHYTSKSRQNLDLRCVLLPAKTRLESSTSFYIRLKQFLICDWYVG